MKQESYKKIILPMIVFFIIVAIWSAIAQKVNNFPTPIDTFVHAFGGTTSDGEEILGVLSDPFYIENEDDKGVFWQIINSLERVFSGFMLAVIIGVPVGLAIGMSRNFQLALEPYIQIFKPVSPLAWLPLLLFVFQDINTTAISTIFVTSIWPIIINTALGVKSVNEDYLNVAKVLQFTPLEKVRKI
ncbi:MAG: nitrate ABC transporter, permease protein, partial [Deltaproteobacteria bacterium HGW-Deltaproteobacteria-24]